MKRFVRRPSAAMVVACIALLVALGGVGVAATSLPAGSVGSLQLKPNAVTSAKVANGSLKRVDLAPGVQGARGPVGPPGPQGERGPQGPAGGSGGGGGALAGPAGGDLTGNYPDPQIAASKIGSKQVADDSLTGADIDESTLGRVGSSTSSLLGGIGRTGYNDACEPANKSFATCASVALDLPVRTRVLVIAHTFPNSFGNPSGGVCELATSSGGALGGTATVINVPPNSARYSSDNTTLATITPLIGPGSISFHLDCNRANSGNEPIQYERNSVIAVALSPN